MIAPPPQKTTSEEVQPTKIDAEAILHPSQEQSSQPEQQQQEEINPDKTDDESYLPKPDARQSPNFETAPEKITMRTQTWKKAQKNYPPELGIEAGKKDDEADGGTEPKTEKIRSEYSPSRSSSREGKGDASAEKNPEEPEIELPTRNNKLEPPEKGKKKKKGRTGTPTSSEFQVASITVSGDEGETSPMSLEAPISAATEDQAQQDEEDDTMGKSKKRNRSQSPETKKKEQGREKKKEQGKPRLEYEKEKKDPQY